jgi:hypothetical protein
VDYSFVSYKSGGLSDARQQDLIVQSLLPSRNQVGVTHKNVCYPGIITPLVIPTERFSSVKHSSYVRLDAKNRKELGILNCEAPRHGTIEALEVLEAMKH